jgi:hypothetical protein
MSLKKWFAERWVDLGRKKKDGSYAECGRSDSSKGKYPKCVPMSKAMRMSAKQKQSAVRRKRIAVCSDCSSSWTTSPDEFESRRDDGIYC